MFKQIKTKTGLLCMSLGLLISLMGGDCGGTTTNNDCKAPKMTCGGKCIDVNTVSDCGACGTKCDAGAACVQDTSKKDGKFMCQAPCAAGEGRCDGKCVSLSADTNCGACGTVCTDKQKCGNHNGADTNSCLLADDETCTEGAECFGGACPRKTKKCAEAAGFTCEGSKECASSRCTNQPPETEKK